MPENIAIARAREALSIAPEIPGRAVYVARLDCPGSGYCLVCFGAEDATVAVAATNSSDGAVLSHARLSGSGPHLAVTANEAMRLACKTTGAPPELVWRPCRASFSMLYPIWAVATTAGTLYVDQKGQLWTELDAPAPAG